MLRHSRQERTRSGAEYNNETWKTERSLEGVATYLLSCEEFPDSLKLPVENEEWIELYKIEDGRQAVMTSEEEDFQVSVREYDRDWRDNDVDLTYFHHPDYEINRLVNEYMEQI